MPDGIDPALTKTLVEAEGDVARHGVVIIRTIETELVPAIMAEARNSIESSPRKLSKLSEEELDDLMDSLRRTATKAAKDLRKLYTRILAKLGNEDMIELEQDLEGIGQLFKWSRIAEVAGPVNATLEEHGFPQIELSGPADVADNLAVELEEKWQGAFSRFSDAVTRLAQETRKAESSEPVPVKKRKDKRK
jgi:hypothetical protein